MLDDRTIKILDLTEYFSKFNSFLAREKPLFINGDGNLHFERICELADYEITPPKQTADLDDALIRLSKQATLHISEINEFAKIISYFNYLKKIKPVKNVDFISDEAVIMDKNGVFVGIFC